MMNINTIKAFTWLVSATLTAGVGYYVYDFQKRQKVWASDYRISKENAEAILRSAVAQEAPQSSLVKREAIERSYYFDRKNKQLPNLLDWTGARPPVEVAPVVEEIAPVARKIESIGDKISVKMIYDGRAWIEYTAESGVADVKKIHMINVGDTLRPPLEYATVKEIHGQNGIAFAFAGGEREDETILPKEYDPGSEITLSPGLDPNLQSRTTNIPRVAPTWVSPRTYTKGTNEYVLGLEDVQDFGDDFGGIIAREVEHSRHFNQATGKYDGIELKSVKPGGKIAGHGGQSGDIIKSINGHAVTSPSEAISFVKNNQDKYSKWIVIVENKGKERTMTFESPN